jgi:integrase
MKAKSQHIQSANTMKGVSASQRDILGGCYNFRPDLPVSEHSNYGDEVWNWMDTANTRLHSYYNHDLMIKWVHVQAAYDLNDEIITDLKKYAFMRYAHTREVFSATSTHGNAHPATVVREIGILTLFLRHLRAQLSSDGFSLINKLADIEVEDLTNAISDYPHGQLDNVRRVLLHLSSSVLGRLLVGGPLKWNRDDVKNLEWRIKKREPYKRIPDELFRFLSNAATSDIKQFLQALGFEPQDKSRVSKDDNIYLSAFPDFGQRYDEYVTELNKYRRRTHDEKALSRYCMWLRTQERAVGRMRELVERARWAAMVIIAAYTGARLSELFDFRIGCAGQDEDGWFLRGTVIKQRKLDSPVGQDKWVAIPIVRDAVTTLEQAARLAGSGHLFHTARKEYDSAGSRSGRPRMSDTLNKYLSLVDTTRKWDDEKLHVHQFRHTLVFQMRKAGLSLPFITFQLKHYYDALGSRVSDTTLGYGRLAGEATIRAIEEANYEAMRQVFHPDAPLAGGGAEQFKARRAAFFQGMVLQGRDEEGVLRHLAKQGMPLTDVGLGLCQGQKKIVIDGVKVDPPCIGQLRCNPVRCPLSIIPQSKTSAWERIAKDNRQRAQDPELAHAASYHNEVADEADAVVRFLRERKAAHGDAQTTSSL